MEDKLLYKIHIRGRVQGVGFRWSAVKEARNQDIKGFVKNMPDGSVFIEAEGLRENLKTYLEWCKRGPAFGSVESIDVEIYPPVKYKDFSIEY